MALDTRQPPVLAPAHWRSAKSARDRQDDHKPERFALLFLTAFMAITAISGAIFVVPTIPRAWLHQGLIAPFADYIIPALALGILCGGAALVAFITVLVRSRLSALVSIVTGVLMIGFELVEILVVGFTPIMEPTLPPAWLQPFYIVVGVAITLLGLRLWRSETGSYRWRPF